jgi:hypothetical protein
MVDGKRGNIEQARAFALTPLKKRNSLPRGKRPRYGALWLY